MKYITVRARKSRVSRRLTILLCSLCVAGVLLVPAQAADVVIKSSVSQKISVNDNYDLVSSSPGAVLVSRTSLSASILAEMPTFVIGTGLSLSYLAYAGPGRGTRENGFDFPSLNFNATKTLKNTTFTVSGSFSIDDTATTQIDDTGIIDINANQITSNLNAGVSRNINNNNSISVDISATSVSFSEGADQFTPYIDVNVSGQWTHLVNSNIQTGLTSSIGFYQADGASELRRRIFKAGGTASVQLTKTFSVNGGLGVDVVSAEGSGAMPASFDILAVGYSGNFSANYRGNRTEYALNMSHGVEPSASGRLEQRTRLSLTATHDIPINARSDLTLAASYAYLRSASPTISETASQIVRFSPTYSIELTPYWDANLGYTFTYRDEDGEKAHSNLIYFSIARSGTLLP